MNDDLKRKIQELVQESNMKISFEIDFPRYKILPDEVKLALKILQNHDMRILFTVIPIEKTGKELALE